MDIKADVIFVTDLEVSGFMNGVINLALSTAQFLPEVKMNYEGDAATQVTVVSPQPVITANLRFDLRLAQILRDRLDELIEENTKARAAN
jgi:hypothetical protein